MEFPSRRSLGAIEHASHLVLDEYTVLSVDELLLSTASIRDGIIETGGSMHPWLAERIQQIWVIAPI